MDKFYAWQNFLHRHCPMRQISGMQLTSSSLCHRNRFSYSDGAWLYFCKLPAIYCNLSATPLFKSQTLQFIAGGWKRGKYENNARQKLVRTRNDWSFEACHQNRREDIIKMCFHSCRQWRRGWWRRWRLKSVGQLETKTCLERKQGCFEKVGEGSYYIYNLKQRETLVIIVRLDDLC